MTSKPFRFIFQPLTLTSSVLAAVAIAVGVMPHASAQTTTPQPLDNPQSADRSDIFSNRGGNQSTNMLDIIHRALQGQSRSPEDYDSEQRDNLNDAAAQFRARQKLLLQNQSGGTPSSGQPSSSTDSTRQ
jgi:hypothetical protein